MNILAGKLSTLHKKEEGTRTCNNNWFAVLEHSPDGTTNRQTQEGQ